jgi:hypothetical protein
MTLHVTIDYGMLVAHFLNWWHIFMNWSKYSLKALLTVIWNVGGTFLTPNGITIQTIP